MQAMPPKKPLSDLRRTAPWKPDASRAPIEHLLEYLLTGTLAANAPSGTEALAEQVLHFDLHNTRVVVLGGGTGLSTVAGGNSQMPGWPDEPCVGLKQEFPNLDFVVCTTDDGGSTGKLLESLPMIGVGDLRKLLISSILSTNLQQRYGLPEPEALDLIRMIHSLFNYRFSEQAFGFELLQNPLLAVPSKLRAVCPKALAESLRELGAFISPSGSGPTIAPAGHALGNLLLTAAIFIAAQGETSCPPDLRELQDGVDKIAELIGAPVGRIHPATATPGQLKLRYANGVEVYGQNKSAQSRRSSPVDRVVAEFIQKPAIGDAVRNAINKADLIVYAPGSLYTSIIPILQLEPIVDAIRSNKRALKILGANSWVQEGETDISLKNVGRGFLVSELIEAYGRNVPGGIGDLFDVVLSANLEHIPGNILRNYALEGKSPIHLDRSRVEAMGFRPVEATLFLHGHEKKTQVIHHDARRFTLAIRTLLYANLCLKHKKGYVLRHSAARKKSPAGDGPWQLGRASAYYRSQLLCDYMSSIKEALSDKEFQPAGLREILLELAWENRDIRPSHLKHFRGTLVIPSSKWSRSTEWDPVLGYYDPEDQYLKLHEERMDNAPKLREDLLIALGESLLGRYIEMRRWIKQNDRLPSGARCYEIVLRPIPDRECFLSDSQLRTYLQLARLTPEPGEDRCYRITINPNEGFLPPGLLFGLTYAWYLNNAYGFTMEYEMSLLRWPPKSLIPYHAKDRIRKEALVTFFRNEVFGHT